jgi:4-amino-4-deoxy-L-arabinose transferase-like glycosyltransferase
LRVPRARASAAVFVVWTLLVSAVFGRLALHNLANFRPVSNDEGELIAVGYKLATRGVLGSDMYAGFFGADQHLLYILPVQHLLEALSFKVFGAGIAQARLVSVLAAVSIVWVVGWLAYRWYGLAAGMLSEFLLVGWQSNLTEAWNGLPLLGVARTARYDVLAVAFAWLSIACLDVTLRRPRPVTALAAGICAGLASLSQFFGAFVLPLLLVAAVWNGRRRSVGWLVSGAAMVILPWMAYAARHADDLRGQLVVYGDRGDFLRPTFYVENALAEPRRFAHLLTPPAVDFGDPLAIDYPLSPWLLVLGALPAVVYLARRGDIGDRLLLGSLVSFGGLLLLVDQTKVPLYAILLLPPICIALAAGWIALFRLRVARVPVCVLTLGLLLTIGWEGVRAYQVDFEQANRVSTYVALGQQMEAGLTPNAAVLGPERWWWALHEHPYLSLRSIWWQWSDLAAKSGASPDISHWFSRQPGETVIVNVNVRDDIRSFPATLQTQFWRFLARCTTQVDDIVDVNYFEIEVYQVTSPLPGPEACIADDIN